MRSIVTVLYFNTRREFDARKAQITRSLKLINCTPLFMEAPMDPHWQGHISNINPKDSRIAETAKHVMAIAAQESADILIDACSSEGRMSLTAYQLLYELEGMVIHGSTVYALTGVDKPNLRNIFNSIEPMKVRLFVDIQDFQPTPVTRQEAASKPVRVFEEA